jgi:hypothetical protein
MLPGAIAPLNPFLSANGPKGRMLSSGLLTPAPVSIPTGAAVYSKLTFTDSRSHLCINIVRFIV